MSNRTVEVTQYLSGFVCFCLKPVLVDHNPSGANVRILN